MATNQAFDVPFAGRWKEPTERDDGEEIVSEPVGDEATKKIWTSQGGAPNSEEKDNPPTNSDKPATESESKEENPKEQDQQNPSEPPILSPTKENVDEHANSHGESPNKVKGDGVEEDTTEKNEETKGGPDPETRSLHTEDLPLDSTNSQPKPSASAKSNQASSTQEHTHDFDSMPEAEAGGPEIISVSSTSKLSASLGVQEEEFTNMQKSNPAALGIFYAIF
ncbi:hypothetical protein P8452_66360 [Trifolium repens]|nr:hypothetical protein P8452_66360 [Trifolium repens]